MLAVTLRVFGVTLIDLSIDTDSPSSTDADDGPSVVAGERLGFEYRPDLTLPSTECE